ncbi:MAG: hypothetical protein IJH07_09270 [Ruminococcus sp.]|nr:hypothetical protein [Ruminococcus sp.]
MPKTKLTINAKTLFPIDQLKKHLKEALAVCELFGSAIITQNNRPAYAIIRIDDDQRTDHRDLGNNLAEQIDLAHRSAKGNITTEPCWWENNQH